MTEPIDNSAGEAFELDCLFNWMRFLTEPLREYSKGDLVVHVYGELDDSYIVIEKQVAASPITLDQYLVHTQDAANSLMSLVRLVREFGFDLKSLVSKLEQLDYDVDGCARLEHVEIYYRQVQESVTADQGQDPMKDKSKGSSNDVAPKVVFRKRKFEAPAKDPRSIDEIAKSLSPFDKKHPPKASDVEEFDEWE